MTIPNTLTFVAPSQGAIFNANVAAEEEAAESAAERNELTLAAYYKFDKNWSISAGGTGEITHPRAILRYSISAGYTDDCSSFTLNVSHDQTLIVGGGVFGVDRLHEVRHHFEVLIEGVAVL